MKKEVSMTYEEVMEIAQKNYFNCGDIIVECFDPEDVAEMEFKTKDDIKKYCERLWDAKNETRFGDEELEEFNWID